VNAVPLAGERETDFFADQGPAIGGDGNGVLEIGDTPVAGLRSGGSGSEGEKKRET
jgi:hypothetical protein